MYTMYTVKKNVNKKSFKEENCGTIWKNKPRKNHLKNRKNCVMRIVPRISHWVKVT